MARQLPKYYDLVDDDARIKWHGDWLTEWLEEIYGHPARLIIEIPEPLEAGHEISVVAVAETEAPPWWGFCLVAEQLTEHTTIRLTTALLTVKRLLGLDLHEAFAFLIHQYLFHFDLRRAAREAKKSILVGPWEHLGISDADMQERLAVLRRKPVWQLQAVLDCWAIYGGQFPTRLLDNPGFLPKAVSYLTIPPILSEDISTDERAKQILVPVLVELANKRFLDSILAAKREGNRAGILMDFGVLDEQRHLAGSVEQTVFSQESDSQSGFTHSPDFHSVSLSGEQFSLTSKQAQVVQILFEAYQNGTPEVGQAYILEELGSASGRLQDSFRSRKEAWGKLIIPGKTKGTYRLNL
jgi:hypothetical protein